MNHKLSIIKRGAIIILMPCFKGCKKTQWREKNCLFSKLFSNTRAAILKRIKLDYFLIPYTKVNSKWLKDINVRPETIKHQE